MTRRKFALLLVVSVVLSAGSSVAHARRGVSRGKGPSGTFHGVIAAVSGNTIRLNIGKEAEKIVTFWTDDKTKITGGGKEGTLADLKPGMKATIKSREGRASSVAVEVEGNDKGEKTPSGGK